MRIGEACSFYHEGGRGERRWIVGWRYGIVRAVPTKGQHKHYVHVEIPVPLWTFDQEKKTWTRRPNARAWVHGSNVNEPGDNIFHGERLAVEVRARKETKKKQQAKADKVKRVRLVA